MDFELIEDAVGLNPVKSMGQQLTILPIELDFSGVTSYSTDGEELDLTNHFNYDENIMVFITMQDGYLFEYDETAEKVIVYEGDGTDGIAEVDSATDISAIGKTSAIALGY